MRYMLMDGFVFRILARTYAQVSMNCICNYTCMSNCEKLKQKAFLKSGICPHNCHSYV